MNVQNFINALPVMGLGMVGVFIVTTIIVCVVGLLNFFGSVKKDN